MSPQDAFVTDRTPTGGLPPSLRRTIRRHRRNRHSGAPRSPAVGAVSHPRRRRPRHHLDPRRARGDARRRRGRCPEAKSGAAVQQYRHRARRQRLHRRGRARRGVLRLADGPAGPQEALLHHACRLSARHGSDGAVLEYRGASCCSGFSPAPASAASTWPSTRPSRSSSRRACAAGPISSSTAASGSGAAIGAVGSIVLLDPALFDPDIGWRVAFLIGAALAVVIFFMRMWIPESPRWLMTHGRAAEAQAIVAGIEERSRAPRPPHCRRARCRPSAFAPAAIRRWPRWHRRCFARSASARWWA